MRTVNDILTVPELQTYIFNYLGRTDRAVCMRVSQSWHKHFESWVWNAVDLAYLYHTYLSIQEQPQKDQQRSVLENALRRYGPLVRKISSYVTAGDEHQNDTNWRFLVLDLVVQYCRRLEHASVLVASFQPHVLCDTLQPLLINNSASLTHLELTSLASPSAVVLSEVLVHATALRSLTWTFYACMLDPKMLVMVWIACPRLEVFRIGGNCAFRRNIPAHWFANVSQTATILLANQSTLGLRASRMRLLTVQVRNQSSFLAAALQVCPFLVELEIQDEDCSVEGLAAALEQMPPTTTVLSLSSLKTRMPLANVLNENGNDDNNEGQAQGEVGQQEVNTQNMQRYRLEALTDDQTARIVRAIPPYQLNQLYLWKVGKGDHTM